MRCMVRRVAANGTGSLPRVLFVVYCYSYSSVPVPAPSTCQYSQYNREHNRGQCGKLYVCISCRQCHDERPTEVSAALRLPCLRHAGWFSRPVAAAASVPRQYRVGRGGFNRSSREVCSSRFLPGVSRVPETSSVVPRPPATAAANEGFGPRRLPIRRVTPSGSDSQSTHFTARVAHGSRINDTTQRGCTRNCSFAVLSHSPTR